MKWPVRFNRFSDSYATDPSVLTSGFTLQVWDNNGAVVDATGATWIETGKGGYQISLPTYLGIGVGSYHIENIADDNIWAQGDIPADVFHMLPSAYIEGNSHSFANILLRDHQMLDKLIETRSENRQLLGDIDDFTATYSGVLADGAYIDITGDYQFPSDDTPPIFGRIQESAEPGVNEFVYDPEDAFSVLSGWHRGLILTVRVYAPSANFPSGTLTITRSGLYYPVNPPLALELPEITAAAAAFGNWSTFQFDASGNFMSVAYYGRVKLTDVATVDTAAIAAAVRDVSNATPAAGSLGADVATAPPPNSSVDALSAGAHKAVMCRATINTSPVVVVVQSETGFIRDEDDGNFKMALAITTMYQTLIEDIDLMGVFWGRFLSESWSDGIYVAYVYASSAMDEQPISSVMFQVFNNVVQTPITAAMRKLRNIEVRK